MEAGFGISALGTLMGGFAAGVEAAHSCMQGKVQFAAFASGAAALGATAFVGQSDSPCRSGIASRSLTVSSSCFNGLLLASSA